MFSSHLSEMIASTMWKRLNGVVCLYKPAGTHIRQVRQRLLELLANDLTQIRAPNRRCKVLINGNPKETLSVTTVPDFAADPLVVGPAYVAEDIHCSWATYVGRETSGVLVMGLNKAAKEARKFNLFRLTRTFHIKGKLGYATDTHFSDGKVVEKASFNHVKQLSLDRILSAMQAAHQKHMFLQCGLDIQSQAAYDIASKGLIRPHANTVPILYNIRCIYFSGPDFVIEVTSVNDTEQYLKTLIHEIGLQLKTCATCMGIQCIRHGDFTLEHALLHKDWHLSSIINNMDISAKIIQNIVDKISKNASVALMEQSCKSISRAKY